VETVVDKMSDKGQMSTTGQMGDVMKESTKLAYTYAKTFIDKADSGNKFFETVQYHSFHLP
jgi:Lon-like ATP-dependent protease